MSKPEDTSYPYDIKVSLVAKHLRITLEECKALETLERSKKEARSRIASIRDSTSSALHHLRKLEESI